MDDSGGWTLALLIFCGGLWTAWLLWAADSPKAGSKTKAFAAFLLMTSWPWGLALILKRLVDARFASNEGGEDANA